MLILLLTIFLTTTQAAAARQNTAKPMLDMRALVDVSGSMKESDPDNLRCSALRMLSGLLPDGSRARVWTFGRYVNMRVPHGTVDKKWRKKVQIESGKIHSYGLYTNIEGVLVKSTWDWKQTDKRYKRRMILLSDGMVDMSKDAAVNKRIRNRILLVSATVASEHVGKKNTGVDDEAAAQLKEQNQALNEENERLADELTAAKEETDKVVAEYTQMYNRGKGNMYATNHDKDQ